MNNAEKVQEFRSKFNLGLRDFTQYHKDLLVPLDSAVCLGYSSADPEEIINLRGKCDPLLKDQHLEFKVYFYETLELQEAILVGSREDVLSESADVLYTIFGLMLSLGIRVGELSYDENGWCSDYCQEELLDSLCCGTLEDIKASCINVILSIYGSMFLRGHDKQVLDEAFDRIHKQNMSKVDDEGNPVYAEDGKVMKGPNYKKADLSDLV